MVSLEEKRTLKVEDGYQEVLEDDDLCQVVVEGEIRHPSLEVEEAFHPIRLEVVEVYLVLEVQVA